MIVKGSLQWGFIIEREREWAQLSTQHGQSEISNEGTGWGVVGWNTTKKKLHHG